MAILRAMSRLERGIGRARGAHVLECIRELKAPYVLIYGVIKAKRCDPGVQQKNGNGGSSKFEV